MSDYLEGKYIDDLEEATSASDNDLMIIEDEEDTKKIKWSTIITKIKEKLFNKQNVVDALGYEPPVNDTQGLNILKFTSNLPVTGDLSTGIKQYLTSAGKLTNIEGGIRFDYTSNLSTQSIQFPFIEDDIVKNGDTITFSFEARGTLKNAGQIIFMQRTSPNLSHDVGAIEMSETEWRKFSYVLTIPRASERICYSVLLFYNTKCNTGDWLEIKNESLKIELGAVENPIWTPAPQDIPSMSDVSNATNAQGVNLLTNSDQKNIGYSYSESTVTVEENVFVSEWSAYDAFRVYGTSGNSSICYLLHMPQQIRYNATKKYTASVYVKNNSDEPLSIILNGLSNVRETLLKGESRKVVLHMHNNEGTAYVQLDFITSGTNKPFDFIYWHPKIEEGIVEDPTWTLAPSDVDAKINHLKDNIGGAQILRGSNSGLSLTLTTGWSTKSWSGSSNNANTRNVIDITDCPNILIKKGVYISESSGTLSYGIAQVNVPVISGQKYTMSCYAKGSANLRFQYGKNPYVRKAVNITNEWRKYEYTFTIGEKPDGSASGITNIYFEMVAPGDIYICGMKLELGEVATDWCEYEGDMATKNDIASIASIQQANIDYLSMMTGIELNSTINTNDEFISGEPYETEIDTNVVEKSADSIVTRKSRLKKDCSEKYNDVMSYFQNDYWNETQTRNAVVMGWITPEEFEEITGKNYF